MYVIENSHKFSDLHLQSLAISSKIGSVKRQAPDVARSHRTPSYLMAFAHVYRRRYHDYWITPLSQRVAHRVTYRQHIHPFTRVSCPVLDRAALEEHLRMRRSLKLSRSSRPFSCLLVDIYSSMKNLHTYICIRVFFRSLRLIIRHKRKSTWSKELVSTFERSDTCVIVVDCIF